MKDHQGIAILLAVMLSAALACGRNEPLRYSRLDEITLEEAMAAWPEMPQQITFIGLRNGLTKFQIYWNGAISCFTGRDCFGNLFPPQEVLALQHEHEQLHLTFAGGKVPSFAVIDSGQVQQALLRGYLPVISSKWETGGVHYETETLATSLDPEALDPEKSTDISLALVRVTVEAPAEPGTGEVHFWLNFSGYRTLVPTVKEKPEDEFPEYGVPLFLRETTLFDGNGKIRATWIGLPEGTGVEFYPEVYFPDEASDALKRAERKGFLRNLMHLTVPCQPGQKVSMVLALPYFPVERQLLPQLERDFNKEKEAVTAYWEGFYERDAVLDTPDPFVNHFYKSGLWRTMVTADRDGTTGLVYAKSSPAWYETIWPNCAMVSVQSMDMRGFHEVAASYLEPFLQWQSVRDPPGMEGASGDGFLCPPASYCAIPWVSNHGNILYTLCEHYRITRDPEWAKKITGTVLKACDWVVTQRELTRDQEFGAGMLPGGTVSDDRGSGQYLCSDAQNYRGLESAALFLAAIGHPKAAEVGEEAAQYRADIVNALNKRVSQNDSITLIDGTRIPYVPSEIHQEHPPAFDPYDFWPYINYIDVGPMYLVDSRVVQADSDFARWILEFESQYPVARLDHPISLTENWVNSIKKEGNYPATLLVEGVSTIEPFYAPRSTFYLENDRIEDYIHLFYNQLAAGVSHRNLAPCENRYGVWHMPWADGEFHRMLLRMLVNEEEGSLVLLKAIPRDWLSDGKVIRIARQPTAYGKIGLEVVSKTDQGMVEMRLTPPPQQVPAGMKIRLRHPGGRPISKVDINGKSWKGFDDETVMIPGNMHEKQVITVRF